MSGLSRSPIHWSDNAATSPVCDTPARQADQDRLGNAARVDLAGLGATPRAPGAGPVEEDLLARQLAFDATPFSLTDFVPSTGTGRFDVCYDPEFGELMVELRVGFDFAPPRDAPLMDRLSDMVGLDDGWSEEAKAQARQTFIEQVESTWDRQYVFACVRPGWERYRADVRVHVVAVPEGEEDTAHYVVRTHAAGAAERSINPTARSNAHTDHGDGVVELNESDLERWRMDSKVQDVERERLRHALTDVSVPYARDLDGCVVPTAEGEAALARVGAVLRAALPSTHAFDVNAHGWAERASDETDALDAQDAAAHTADTLRASGCPQVVAPLADGSGIPGAVAFRLSDDGPERPDPTYPVVQYAPAAHEAGHMFGLPDEYPVDWSPFEAIGADLQWGRFEAMARAAGAAPPPPATDTSSLMSMGPDVLPCHYAMFHEALARMTSAFLVPSEWRMEPSPTCRAARRPPVYAPFSAQGAEVE